jgi:hypothetical protein
LSNGIDANRAALLERRNPLESLIFFIIVSSGMEYNT